MILLRNELSCMRLGQSRMPRRQRAELLLRLRVPGRARVEEMPNVHMQFHESVGGIFLSLSITAHLSMYAIRANEFTVWLISVHSIASIRYILKRLGNKRNWKYFKPNISNTIFIKSRDRRGSAAISQDVSGGQQLTQLEIAALVLLMTASLAFVSEYKSVTFPTRDRIPPLLIMKLQLYVQGQLNFHSMCVSSSLIEYPPILLHLNVKQTAMLVRRIQQPSDTRLNQPPSLGSSTPRLHHSQPSLTNERAVGIYQSYVCAPFYLYGSCHHHFCRHYINPITNTRYRRQFFWLLGAKYRTRAPPRRRVLHPPPLYPHLL